MKILFSYLQKFRKEEFRWSYFIPVTLFLVATTWIFYAYKNVGSLIGGGAAGSWRSYSDLIIYSISFLIPLLLYPITGRKQEALRSSGFWFMVMLALCVFSFRVFFYWQRPLAIALFGNDHISYWQNVLSGITGFVMLVFPVFVYWFIVERKERPFYGISSKQFNAKPYLLILLIMLPFLILASSRPDFLQQYPKAFISLDRGGITDNRAMHTALFEGSYALDFLGTEIFFRGFLVIGLGKYLGRSVIIPAAVFYVFIHYGKPLAETMSSFAGGIFLGILAFETRSIWSGVILHLGTALLLELSASFFR